MRLAKVDSAYFACFENKWIEVTDSATVEQLKADLDEEEIQKVLEDLKKALEEKAAEKTRQQPSDKSEAVSSSESEEPESSSSEECTGRRCKDNVSSSSAKKHSNEESSDSEPESSGSDEPPSSSSGSMEITYAFGYALKNDPTPSKGCGTTSKLRKTKSVENGDRFEMKVNSETRDYFITLPKNYDNKKPYKLLFAMHCMGSNAEDFVHTTLEENYCIDTSRVFMTGFSLGAMVTNSMAQDMQDRLRAVAVYAVADYNIYLPKNKGLPIAWMAVHGKNDYNHQYNRARDSALKRILRNNGKADADGNFTDASEEKPKEVGGSGHLCYDFTTVDERFPVKWCSWNGEHQWTAYDSGDWQNTWVPQEVHKFFEQF